MTTTAQIAAKGCSSTGITEEIAKTLHDNLGRKLLAVVELVAESRTENRDGDEKVGLSILTIEPAPNGMTADHLRNLARSFHYERKLALEGPTLPMPGDSPEPTVEEVTAAGAALKPHDFTVDELGEGECNICGLAETAPVHADASKLVDPFSVSDTAKADETQADETDDEEPETANPDDPAFDPHPFTGDPEDDHISCTVCGLTEHVAVHTEATVPA